MGCDHRDRSTRFGRRSAQPGTPAGPATGTGHGVDPGRPFPDGLRPPLRRGGPGSPGGGGWLLDRPHHGDQRPVPQVCEGHGPRHPGGTARRSRHLPRGPAGPAAACFDRVCAAARAGGAGRSLSLVAIRARGELAPSGGTRQLDQRPRPPSGGAHRPCRCPGLCRLGGQGAALGGGMGASGPGRAGRGGVRLGGGTPSGRPDAGQHLAGRLPPPQQPRRWLGGHRAGGQLSAQRLRPARHGGQRVGVDRRLVPGARGPTGGGAIRLRHNAQRRSGPGRPGQRSGHQPGQRAEQRVRP